MAINEYETFLVWLLLEMKRCGPFQAGNDVSFSFSAMKKGPLASSPLKTTRLGVMLPALSNIEEG